MELIAVTGILTLINILGVTAVTEYHPYFEGHDYKTPIVEIEEYRGPESLMEFMQSKSILSQETLK